MKENTRQHYIPQIYLSNFSNDGKGVWVYNKTRSKKYITSTDKICYKDDFYSLGEQIIEESEGLLNRLSIEKKFFARNVEIELSTILKQLVESVDENIRKNPRSCLFIDEHSKRLIAQHIAIQFLRLPELREYLEKFERSLIRAVKKITDCDNCRKASNYNEIEDFLTRKRDPAFEHFDMGFGAEELINDYSERLVNNFWEFYINPNGDYYTSDFPIVVEPHVKNTELECLGLAMYGAEVTYPITKKLLLKIWDNRYFPQKKENDGCFLYATDKFVRYEKIRQYLFAREIVISPIDDFSLPELITKIEGKEVSYHPNFICVNNWD